jgi:hypothetical protein
MTLGISIGNSLAYSIFEIEAGKEFYLVAAIENIKSNLQLFPI